MAGPPAPRLPELDTELDPPPTSRFDSDYNGRRIENKTEVISEYIYCVTLGSYIALEEHIKVLLQPKPKYLPVFIWHKLIRRLIIVMQENVITK